MLGARKDGVGPAHMLWTIPNPLKGSLRPQLLALNQNPQAHPGHTPGAEGHRSSVPGSTSEEQLVSEASKMQQAGLGGT